MNRGLQRRPLFELPSDIRRFLALLVCASRAGRIRVHCFCVLNTHFHLIVESVDGDLSSTMGWIQSRHAGHFNRTRGRYGPLVGGRFKSIPIESRVYLFVLFRYIDLNPVKAGLVSDPLEYEFSSAAHHANSDRSPLWLARPLVDGFMGYELSRGIGRRAAYRNTIHALGGTDHSLDLVEARLQGARRGPDDLDAFLQADGARRREWLVERAAAADGTDVGLPLVAAGSVRQVVATRSLAAPASFMPGPRGGPVPIWSTLEVGLLRDLAGLGYSAIARLIGLSTSTAFRRYERHRDALGANAPYLTLAAEVAGEALVVCFGPRVVALCHELAHGRLVGPVS